MEYIKLLLHLIKPLVYVTAWGSTLAIIIITIHDIEIGYILFTEVMRVLIITYLVWALVVTIAYFITSKKGKNKW